MNGLAVALVAAFVLWSFVIITIWPLPDRPRCTCGRRFLTRKRQERHLREAVGW